jgi:predicted DCC family thiol-disulfide oxidoreductase YuxK
MSGSSPVLLYDGLCGFCDASVRFLLRRDRTGQIRYAPLQGEFARGVIARHPELTAVDALILVEQGPQGERCWIRSDAVLRVVPLLGGGWRLVSLLRGVPRPLRDTFYAAFARVRHRVSRQRADCRIPEDSERSRFL